jgi:NodT family efflux transporter outer membrane factor (OMF) lipoprotein
MVTLMTGSRILKSGLCLAAATVLLGNMTGCTSCRDYVRNGYKVGPNYCKPDAAVADHWIDDANPSVSSDPPNDSAWWQTFGDPVLDNLVQTAYRQNLTLRIAGQRILEAKAQQAIAVGNVFPQTQQASGGYARTAISQNVPLAAPPFRYDNWSLGTNLAWELDFWGRFRRAIAAADARLDASVENYDDVLVLLLAQVAESYADLRTSEQRLVYARKNVKDQEESLDLAKVKFNNGATTKLDVTQGESNLGQTQATIPPLEAARRQSANQICILLGMPPRDIEEMLGKRTIPSASPKVALGIPADLLRRRPDVRRAERNVAAQSEQIGIATAELYPHFSITGNIYVDSENFRDLFQGNSLGGSIGPSFQWNVLNYGRLVNGIRVQQAIFEELALQYQETVLNANAEVENSVVGFLQAQQQVKFLATSVTASQESLDLVRTQYNEGKTDFNRVLSVEQLLTQQEDQLAVAQGAVATNLITVYKSLGGGWQIRLSEDAAAEQAAESTAASVTESATGSATEPVVPPPEAPTATPGKPSEKPAKAEDKAPAKLPAQPAAKAIERKPAAKPVEKPAAKAEEESAVEMPSEPLPIKKTPARSLMVSAI